jgi:ubiquitin C-terminal hydrolase
MNELINGTTGLTNQGNTCYVNSIIQCLSNCKDFRNFLLNNKIIHLLNKYDNIFIARKNLNNTLTFQLRKIFSYFWFNDYKVIELSSFRKIFCKKIDMFRNFNQHDSQEALLCIIDTIHEELAQNYDIIPKNKDIIFDSLNYYYNNDLDYDILKIINSDISKYLNFKSFIDFKNTHKNYSNIYDIFEGRTISQLKCPLTNGIKANFESQFYFTLSLINNKFEDSSSDSNNNESSNNSENDTSNENSINDDTCSTSSESSVIEKYKNIINLNKYENESNELFSGNNNNYKEDIYENSNSDSNVNDCSQNSYENNNSDSNEDDNIDNSNNSNYDDDQENYSYSDNSENKSIEYESNEFDVDENSNYLKLFTNLKKKKIKKCNIYDLFDNFSKMEILDNENQWYSPYCQQKVNAEKINLIWDSPKIFIILIKRFEYTEYGPEKLNHLVDFPIYDLDITNYLHKNHVSKYTKYNLFAINNHDSMNSNGINFGHYYSYCKNSIDNKWYNFDDDDVNEIDENKLITNKAYMLFYEAIN